MQHVGAESTREAAKLQHFRWAFALRKPCCGPLCLCRLPEVRADRQPHVGARHAEEFGDSDMLSLAGFGPPAGIHARREPRREVVQHQHRRAALEHQPDQHRQRHAGIVVKVVHVKLDDDHVRIPAAKVADVPRIAQAHVARAHAGRREGYHIHNLGDRATQARRVCGRLRGK
eukprot:1915349-Prymnesium_polylepis.1